TQLQESLRWVHVSKSDVTLQPSLFHVLLSRPQELLSVLVSVHPAIRRDRLSQRTGEGTTTCAHFNRSIAIFQSKLIDRIPDVLWIHYLGRSVERVHQLQEPRLEHRKRLSQASFDEDPVL